MDVHTQAERRQGRTPTPEQYQILNPDACESALDRLCGYESGTSPPEQRPVLHSTARASTAQAKRRQSLTATPEKHPPLVEATRASTANAKRRQSRTPTPEQPPRVTGALVVYVFLSPSEIAIVCKLRE